MENYEIIKSIDDFKTRISELEIAVNIENVKSELAKNESLMTNPNFWNDPKSSAQVLKTIKVQKDKIETFASLNELLEELQLYFEMIDESEDILAEIEELIPRIENELSNFEIRMLLSQPYDDNDAIVEMHPGAGGTESQDWCEMLYRMYKYYCDSMGFTIEVLDYQGGEEAGIKSVSFIVHGEKAYGYFSTRATFSYCASGFGSLVPNRGKNYIDGGKLKPISKLEMGRTEECFLDKSGGVVKDGKTLTFIGYSPYYKGNAVASFLNTLLSKNTTSVTWATKSDK